MHKLGVLIYNNNKGKELLDCIQSVLSSDMDDYDIFVIDDASTDDSVKLLQHTYQNRIEILKNAEQIGSCKSLCLGVQQVLDHGYEYLCCLGNDVTVAPDTLSSMLTYLKTNPEVGIVGGKVYHKHMPHYIQQYGVTLDFKHFRAITLYADTPDSHEIPNILYCDAVSSCGFMLPASVIKKVGLPPEDNYLYWDDMEWGYQIKLAGFQVVALGEAKIYHASSPKLRMETTLANYYMTRNCLHFFMKYTKEESCAKMSIVLLRAVFEDFYLHKMSQAHNMAQTSIAALLDALAGLRDKAPLGRILENDENGLGFVSFFEECESVYLENDDPFSEEILRQINPELIFFTAPDDNAITIARCDSILKMTDLNSKDTLNSKRVYVDKSYHLLAIKEDFEAIAAYESSLQLFLYMMQPVLLHRVEEMRNIAL